MKNKNIGSNLDDFIKKEGLLDKAEAKAVKRVVAYKVAKRSTKKAMAKVSLKKADYLLDEKLMTPKFRNVKCLLLNGLSRYRNIIWRHNLC